MARAAGYLITSGWEIYQQRMTEKQIAERLGKHRETIYLWINGIRKLGLLVIRPIKFKGSVKRINIICMLLEVKSRDVPHLFRCRPESAAYNPRNLSLSDHKDCFSHHYIISLLCP